VLAPDAPDAAGAGVPEAAAVAGRFDALSRGLAEEAGLLVRPVRLWTEEEHIFSHIRWKVDVYLAEFGFFLDGGRDASASAEPAAGAVAGAASGAAARIAVEVAAGNADGNADGNAAGIAAEAGASYGGPTDADDLPDGWLWIGPGDMASLAFPNVFLRILNEYFARQT
jgi:A/G-specific adenine glycosylase